MGGGAVDGILEWEEHAILPLIEEWGLVDRSHRKLAHRGSYTGQVFASPSTLLRVALKHRVTLPGEPVRARPRTRVFPGIEWEKNRIWIWDATRQHPTRRHRHDRAAATQPGPPQPRPATPRPPTGVAHAAPPPTRPSIHPKREHPHEPNVKTWRWTYVESSQTLARLQHPWSGGYFVGLGRAKGWLRSRR